MKIVKSILFAFVAGLNGILSAGFVSQSMGVKSGVITAPTGADDNLKTLGASQPVRETLMGVVRQAFQLASALKTAVINFGVRKTVIVPAAQSLATVAPIDDVALLGTITKTGTGATTTWDIDSEGLDAAIEGAIEDLFTPTTPKYSVESLVNKLDELNDNAAVMAAHKLIAVIDQGTSSIKVYRATAPAAEASHTAAVALAEDVQYVQTLDDGGTQFGE